MKRFIFPAALLAFLVANATSARSLSEILASKKLIVGMSKHDYPPFYSGQKAAFTGFDVDLAREIGKALGVEVQFHREAGSFPKLPQMLTNHHIDVVIAAYRINLSRAKLVQFSIPYQTEKHIFLTLRKNEGRFKTTIDTLRSPFANKKRITTGLLRQTTYNDFFEKTYPSSIVTYYDRIDQLVDQLRKEHIEIAYVEESVINHWLDNHREDVLFLSKYFTPKEVDQLAFAVEPNSDHLLAWLNLFIKEKKQDGTLAALSAKYLNKTNYQSQEF